METEGPYPDSAYALLNLVGQPSVQQFPYRGFAIVPVDGSRRDAIKVTERAEVAKRPLWLVFTGMGCQWKGMARQMMQFDVFSRCIRKSADVLKQFDMDLIEMVTSGNGVNNSIASVLAAIAAVQPILRRSLGSGATCLGLMKRDSDNPTHFLNSLGKLHTLGVRLNVSSLYPPVPWPVPRGTPPISHLVSWDHSKRWTVAKWNDFAGSGQSAEDVVEVDLEASNVDAYMTGHELDGRIIFPAAGYFVLAWKYLAKRSGKPYKEVPVIFEDMIFHRAIILSKSGPIRFLVSIMRTSGEFEISEAGKVAASGRIRMAEEREVVLEKEPPGPPAQVVGFELDANDIYKELRLRGYEYSGKFQSILKADLQGGDPKKKTEYAFLNVQTRGDLSTLQWFASPLSCTIPVSSTLCSVYYAPLNFHDVMLATGKIAPEALS
ncbi:hypothetical protein V5799_026636, partial [Amblyomma americanum]